jgi:IS5 family transposase
LFKIPFLQQLFKLSDEGLEFLVKERRSFEEFVRLSMMNAILDATMDGIFRE